MDKKELERRSKSESVRVRPFSSVEICFRSILLTSIPPTIKGTLPVPENADTRHLVANRFRGLHQFGMCVSGTN